MNRTSVPITESRHRVKVENSKKHYQFAISTEMVKGNNINSTVSSGLQWEECSMLPEIRPGEPFVYFTKIYQPNDACIICRGDHHKENLGHCGQFDVYWFEMEDRLQFHVRYFHRVPNILLPRDLQHKS